MLYGKRAHSPEFHYDIKTSAIVLITNLLVTPSNLWFQTVIAANLSKVSLKDKNLLVSITVMHRNFTSLQLKAETVRIYQD